MLLRHCWWCYIITFFYFFTIKSVSNRHPLPSSQTVKLNHCRPCDIECRETFLTATMESLIRKWAMTAIMTLTLMLVVHSFSSSTNQPTCRSVSSGVKVRVNRDSEAKIKPSQWFGWLFCKWTWLLLVIVANIYYLLLFQESKSTFTFVFTKGKFIINFFIVATLVAA